MKKMFALFLASVIMMTTAGASAYTLHVLDYMAGEKYHEVDASDCYQTSDGAVQNAAGVKIPAGESATFGYYIPYATRGVVVNHSGSGVIKMITDDNEYEITLGGTSDGVANYFLFRELLGYDVQLWDARLGTNTYFAEREYVEHRGEKNVKIETIRGDVTIHSLLFEKEKTVVPKANILPEVSDYTMRTLNTVVVDETASAIVVSGGLRYVDTDDPSFIPYNYNGYLYLPINTVAKAFGYYHEDMPEKSYALLRSETHEVIMLEGNYTISEGLSGEMPLEEYKAYKESYGENAPELPEQDIIIYHEGKTFAALRYFAELAGKTVVYKDGLVVADDKYTVAEILNTPEFHNYVKNKLAEFKKSRVIGNTYYVSQADNASDENDGGIFTPFRTLNKAASVAQAGDTVVVHAGIYRETLVPKNSGTATAPITYRAAPGEKVTISAADSLGSPALSLVAEDKGKNIYIADMRSIDLGLGRNQIFVNNGTDIEMQTEARHPNGPEHLSDGRLSNAWHSKGNIYKVESGGTDAVTFASDTLLNQTEKDIWKGGIFVGTFGNAYTYISAEIESSEYGKFTVNDKRPKNWWWDTWALQKYKTQDGGNWFNYGCIVGAEAGMDLPGEWVKADSGYLRIKLEEGTNPNDITIEAKARQLCIDLSAKNYINIEGIDTFGGSINMRGSTMCLLNRMDMKYISHFTLTTDQRSMYIDYPYSRETAKGAPQRGETGVFDGGRNNIIVNCTFDHSAGPAIYSTGTYPYIENNIINDCGYMGGYPGGIHFDTENEDKQNSERGGGSVYNNEIYNGGRTCIGWVSGEEAGAYHVPSSWLPMELAYNDIHDGMINTADGGVLYTSGINHGYDGKVTQLHHNFFYNDMPEDDEGEMTSALYYDANVTGFHTYDNAFFTSGGTTFNGQTIFAAPDVPNTHGGRVYNNMELGHIGYNGTDSLREAYFTEGRPYYAGSTLKKDKGYLYMANYNRIKNGENRGPVATAINADLGANVSLRADGYAEFSGNDQYIIFRDVDFGDGSNEMSIYCTGDGNWTNDKLEIQIDDLEPHSVTAMVNAPDLYQTNTNRFVIPRTTGVHDVRVTVKDYKSVCIGGINPYYHENLYKDMEDSADKDVTNFVYISTHNDIVYTANKADFLVVEDYYESNVAAPAYKSTWDDAILYYADEVVEADSTHLVYYGGSRAQYRGQKFRLYALPNTADKKTKEDLANLTPVGEFATRNVSFYDMTPLVFELKKTLPAGTYDFYLELVKSTDKDDKGNIIRKTSNIVGFGLLKDGADLTKYETNPRYYGRLFDADKSVQDPTRPFYKLYGPQLDDGHFMGRLLYTMAGTKAVYTGVDVVKESTKLAVNYTADIGYDNQPVEVYIGDRLIGKFTTVGNDNDRFDTVEIPIESSYNGGKVAEGTYDVTFKFLGNRADEQTCQLFYFTFR